MEQICTIVATSATTKILQTVFGKLFRLVTASCRANPCDVCGYLVEWKSLAILSEEEKENVDKLCARHLEPFEGLDLRDYILCPSCKDTLSLIIESCCMVNKGRRTVSTTNFGHISSKKCSWCPENNNVDNSSLTFVEIDMWNYLCERHQIESDLSSSADPNKQIICTNFNYHVRRALKDCCNTSNLFTMRQKAGLHDQKIVDQLDSDREEEFYVHKFAGKPDQVDYVNKIPGKQDLGPIRGVGQ